MLPTAFPSIPLLAVIIALGAWLVWVLTRRVTGDRFVCGFLLGSYGARVALALGLFAASLWHWPIFKSLQISYGFWAFGLDAKAYHYFGVQIAQAWVKGIELPYLETAVDYFAIVAAVYRFIGSHPLYPIVVNCWLSAMTGLLAYQIGRRLGDDAVARRSALLVSYWPSSLVWSSQLLKDALSGWLVFAALWLVSIAMATEAAPSRWRLLRGTFRLLWLGVVVIILTRLRFYLGSALSVAALAILLPVACYAWFRRQTARGVRCVGTAAVVVLSVLFARTLDVKALISPAHPERGHFRLGVQRQQEGAFQDAEDEFAQAIALKPDYREAYLGLATVKVQQGKLDDALDVYTRYLEREDPQKRMLVKQIIAQIYFERGNHDFEAGHLAEAAAAYERALLFDPTSASLYTNLGIALAQQQKFESALDMLDKALTFATPGAETTEITVARERITAERERLAEAERFRLQQERLAAEAAAYAIQASATPAPPIAPASLRRWLAKPTLIQPRQTTVIMMALAAFPLIDSTDFQTRRSSNAKLVQLTRSVSQMDDEVLRSAYEATPEALDSRREGFVSSGGHSLMDAWAQISTPPKLIAYLPRAMAIGFLAPFPWQWFDVRGSTGVMRVFGGLEMLLLYLLFPCLLWGIWGILAARRVDGLFLLAFVFATVIPVSLVVANLGTLFRLRLMYLLPLLIVAGFGRPLAVYRVVRTRLKTFWGRASGVPSLMADPPLHGDG